MQFNIELDPSLPPDTVLLVNPNTREVLRRIEGLAPVGAEGMGGQERTGLETALREIEELTPEPYAFPADWQEQIRACAECRRYERHPIQQGICDVHRRPLWARERWDSDEEKRIGYRAKTIAYAALRTFKSEPHPCHDPNCGRRP